MKKYNLLKAKQLATLFLLVLVFFCTSASSQCESLVVEDASATGSMYSIVRYLNNTTTVGYFQDYNNGYFVTIDIATGTISAKSKIQQSGLFVSDFRILNDTVYACGKYQEHGILMKFHVSHIGSSNPFKYVLIDSTTELTRMVVYNNTATGNVEIIAIGYLEESIPPYLYHYYRVVDCKSLNNANYRVHTCYSSGIHNERFFDIVLTENYVGLVGSIGESTISLRKASRNSTNIFTGVFDTIYVYTFQDVEPGSRLHATELKGDSIAVASYSAVSSNQFETRIRQYNLQTMSMLFGYAIPTSTKSEPSELSYNKRFSTFLMLEQLEVNGNPSLFEYQVVTQRPHSLGGLESYYVSGFFAQSIASSPNNRTFTLAGGNKFAEKYVWNINYQSCFTKTRISYRDLTPIGHTIIEDGYHGYDDTPNWETDYIQIYPLTSVQDCIHTSLFISGKEDENE